MKPAEIKVGKTYHNGKTGPRSFSARKVLETGVRYSSFNDGVKFLQVEGRYKGETSIISMASFASWAKAYL